MPEWRLCSWSESTEIGKIRSRALGNQSYPEPICWFPQPVVALLCSSHRCYQPKFRINNEDAPTNLFFENSGHRHPSLNILALSQPLSHIIPDLSRWSRNLPSWLLRVLFTEQHIVALIKHGLTSARVGCRLDIINICAHIA